MTSNDNGLPINFYVGTAPLPYGFHEHTERLSHCSEHPESGRHLAKGLYGAHENVASSSVGGKPVEAITLERAYELVTTKKSESEGQQPEDHAIWVTVGIIRTPELYKEGVLAVHPGSNRAIPVKEGDLLVFRFEVPWQLLAFDGKNVIQASDVPENRLIFTLAVWDSGAQTKALVSKKNAKRAAARKKAKQANKTDQPAQVEDDINDDVD